MHAIPLWGKLSVDQNKERVRRRAMGKQEDDYDYHRYKKLLAEAVDERKRIELISRKRRGTGWKPSGRRIGSR